MRIKKKYLVQIRSDKKLRAKIQLITGRGDDTVYRWIRENSAALTTADVVRVITEHFGVTQKELLEPSKKILI